ncbi:MAG: hypothetical protein K2Q01_03345 [Rickettsiales bacterium]|nr:hypothetical protein [Rickettsiales bacterium]
MSRFSLFLLSCLGLGISPAKADDVAHAAAQKMYVLMSAEPFLAKLTTGSTERILSQMPCLRDYRPNLESQTMRLLQDLAAYPPIRENAVKKFEQQFSAAHMTSLYEEAVATGENVAHNPANVSMAEKALSTLESTLLGGLEYPAFANRNRFVGDMIAQASQDGRCSAEDISNMRKAQ